MNTQSTICAISTPAGVGGIAVIRISGPDALSIVQKIWQGKKLENWPSHTAHLGYVNDSQGSTLDQAVATVFRAPHSFTGDDVVEISVHGSEYIQQELIQSLMAAGATLAQPGEFTRRAFAKGNLDLAQAEAVADLIASQTKAQHSLAINQMRGQTSQHLSTLRSQLLELAALVELELDFSEEHVEFASRPQLLAIATNLQQHILTLTQSFKAGQAIKEGIPTAIIGPTNAGKSSLLNALLGDERAIVSDIRGTTRDVIEDTLNINGATLRLMDTAGLRHTTDVVEKLGIDRSLKSAEKASITMLVLPLAENYEGEPAKINFAQNLLTLYNEIQPQLNPETKLLVLLNKSDLNPEANTVAQELGKALSQTTKLSQSHSHPEIQQIIPISTHTQSGLDVVFGSLATLTNQLTHSASPVTIANLRHLEALNHSLESIGRVIEALQPSTQSPPSQSSTAEIIDCHHPEEHHTGTDYNYGVPVPTDFIAQDIRETLHHLGTITGQITTPEILETIFTRFCIGK